MEVINTNFENWGSYLLKQFQIMYEKGDRCDLEISCNDQIFLVHRLIMSACSDYVRELNDKQHIILPKEVSCTTLKTVIDFVYSGKISFNKDEKEELLLAASLLNMRLLTELIKPEESGPYTLHMDDEEDEECAFVTEVANNEVNAEHCESSNLNNSQQQHNQTSYSLGAKRKAETRNNRNKHSKHNAVLPPLHKFPYLQQKFSASRTYGLITNLTSPLPSRFEIPDAELLNCAYRSTFENVTYETESLFRDPDNATSLDEAHHEFLKKLKDNSGHRRGYSNALYSPFDKFAPPPYSIKSEVNNKRLESVISYPSKADAATTRKQQSQQHVVAESRSLPKTAASKPSPAPASKEYRKSSLQATPSNNASSLNVSVEKHVRFADRIDIREIDVDFAAEQVDNDLECLPEPITPSEIVQGPSPINDDDKVELIKLNNAVVPSVLEEHTNLECPRLEETPFISISLVSMPDSYPLAAATLEAKDEPIHNDSIEDTVETQPEAFITNTNTEEATTADLSSMEEVSSRVTFVEEEILPDPQPSKESTTPSVTVPVESHTTTSFSHSASSLLTDTSIFTPLNNASLDTSTEPSSQIFALKVKGTENPDQLNKLVDICKQNPLFKNKNLRFKLVPVRGSSAIQEKLKDHTLIGAGINKAIIVKRSEAAIGTMTPLTAAVAKAPNQSVKSGREESAIKKENKNSHIENVNGPWECTRCTEADGQGKVFGTYFEYRTHLHSVHNEANNPIFCIHCGYKSLKRNMQLYHLFTKHNVAPPSNVNFPKCNQCEYHALNEYYLQKHLSCHPSMGMEYVCSCKVAFKSSELLQKHMVSGDCKNSKSFTCGYCRVIFDRFVNLKAHMRVCMKERSKPMLENNTDRSLKTVSEGGKDYAAL